MAAYTLTPVNTLALLDVDLSGVFKALAHQNVTLTLPAAPASTETLKAAGFRFNGKAWQMRAVGEALMAALAVVAQVAPGAVLVANPAHNDYDHELPALEQARSLGWAGGFALLPTYTTSPNAAVFAEPFDIAKTMRRNDSAEYAAHCAINK